MVPELRDRKDTETYFMPRGASLCRCAAVAKYQNCCLSATTRLPKGENKGRTNTLAEVPTKEGANNIFRKGELLPAC